MKRFHAHVSVPALDPSVRFYSALFGAEPTVLKSDYAKWQLDDPRVNFAISTWNANHGLNHLGIQSESGEEQAAMQAQLEAAGLSTHVEEKIACCYAQSNKAWVEDPAGISWETFHTLASIPARDAAATVTTDAWPTTACCVTQPAVQSVALPNIGAKATTTNSCCS